jgi:hypothetical protein
MVKFFEEIPLERTDRSMTQLGAVDKFGYSVTRNDATASRIDAPLSCKTPEHGATGDLSSGSS